jgi:hypothetical protein
MTTIDDASMVADRRINLMYFLCVRRWMDLRPVLRRVQNLQFGGAIEFFELNFVCTSRSPTQAVVPPITARASISAAACDATWMHAFVVYAVLNLVYILSRYSSY